MQDVVFEFTVRPTPTVRLDADRIVPEATDWQATMINDLVPTTTTAIELDTLQSGVSGDDEAALQECLADLGYAVGKANGDYGSKMVSVIKMIQVLAGMDVTVNADDQTQRVLWGYDAPTAQPNPKKINLFRRLNLRTKVRVTSSRRTQRSITTRGVA